MMLSVNSSWIDHSKVIVITTHIINFIVSHFIVNVHYSAEEDWISIQNYAYANLEYFDIKIAYIFISLVNANYSVIAEIFDIQIFFGSNIEKLFTFNELPASSL